MPDDGPRRFELENAFRKFRLRAKQPAQLGVLTPAVRGRLETTHLASSARVEIPGQPSLDGSCARCTAAWPLEVVDIAPW